MALAVVIVAPVAIQSAFAATTASALPGGASSLQETYQNWQVQCSVDNATKNCALIQQQSDKNGHRVLAIEFVPGTAGGLQGTLVLPFGLLLPAGVKSQIDDQAAGKAAPFHTCLPAGCVVPLAFDGTTVKALRDGTTLKLTTRRGDDSQPITFAVSLKGFAAALDRTETLLK